LSYQYLILFYKIKTKERSRFSVKAQNLALERGGKAKFQVFSSTFLFNYDFRRDESNYFSSFRGVRLVSSFLAPFKSATRATLANSDLPFFRWKN